MNVKKYLQEQAEKDAEALITENDRQFCMELAQKYSTEDKKEKAEPRGGKKKIFKLKRNARRQK